MEDEDIAVLQARCAALEDLMEVLIEAADALTRRRLETRLRAIQEGTDPVCEDPNSAARVAELLADGLAPREA